MPEDKRTYKKKTPEEKAEAEAKKAEKKAFRIPESNLLGFSALLREFFFIHYCGVDSDFPACDDPRAGTFCRRQAVQGAGGEVLSFLRLGLLATPGKTRGRQAPLAFLLEERAREV